MGTDRRTATAVGLILSLVALSGCNGGSAITPSGGSGATTGAPAPTAAAPTASGQTGVGAGAGADEPADQTRDPKPLKGKVILLDPGHNGGNGAASAAINRQVDVGNGRKACDTTGTASNAGYPEHAFTWDVSRRLERLLRDRGAKVVMTRDGDNGVGPCITERAAIGNEADADAAVSIHADGAAKNDHGFHIIRPLPVPGYNTGIVAESKELGLALRKAFRDRTGIPYSTYRGEKAMDARDDLGGLNLSKVPKVFIECGNMRNPGDAAKLADGAFRQRIAEALAEGLDDYLR